MGNKGGKDKGGKGKGGKGDNKSDTKSAGSTAGTQPPKTQRYKILLIGDRFVFSAH